MKAYDVNDLIQEMYDETPLGWFEPEYCGYIFKAIKSLIGDKKILFLPEVKVTGGYSIGCNLAWYRDIGPNTFIYLEEDACCYWLNDPRDAKGFDPDNPPKELIDLIPFIKD